MKAIITRFSTGYILLVQKTFISNDHCVANYFFRTQVVAPVNFSC